MELYISRNDKSVHKYFANHEISERTLEHIYSHEYDIIRAHANINLPAELKHVKDIVPHKTAKHVHSYYHNVITNTKTDQELCCKIKHENFERGSGIWSTTKYAVHGAYYWAKSNKWNILYAGSTVVGTIGTVTMQSELIVAIMAGKGISEMSRHREDLERQCRLNDIKDAHERQLELKQKEIELTQAK